MRKYIKYFAPVFFLLLQTAVFAQLKELGGRTGGERNTGNRNTTSTGSNNENGNNNPEGLITGRLSGDTIPSHIKVWVFKDRQLHNKIQVLDTNLINFHEYDAFLRNNLSGASLGHVGLAGRSNEFFKSTDTYKYIFLNPYKNYLFSNENSFFYSTNLPFTYIKHSASTKQVNEQNLDLLHTQNFSPKTNVGFRYRVINAQGVMTNHKGNINSAAFWASHFGMRYNLQTNFVLNKIQNGENGGIKEEYFEPNLELDPVNLNSAQTKVFNYEFMVHQKYKLGVTKVKERKIQIPLDSLNAEIEEQQDSIVFDTIFIPFISLNHTMKLKKGNRIYADLDNAQDSFYPSFIDSVNTYDSTAYREFENTFQIQFNENQQAKFKFRARAFLRNLMSGNTFSTPYYIGDTLPALDLNTDKVSNTSIGGAVFDYSSAKWDWNFEGEFFIQGRRAADIELLGDMERIFITKKDTFIVSLHANFRNETPSYWYEYFGSNHYAWQNTFKKENKIFASFKFEYPRFKLKTKLDVASLDNFIYFNENAQPAQFDKNIQVVAASVSKNLKFGSFYWNNEFVFQVFSQRDIIQMPEIIYKTQLYADFFLFNKALRLQPGLEMSFTNEYNTPGYCPALGQFYQNTNQGSTLIPVNGGNYPLVKAFANFKVKKVLFFISYNNLVSVLNSKHQYTTHLYPVEKLTLHWGVSWRFYD